MNTISSQGIYLPFPEQDVRPALLCPADPAAQDEYLAAPGAGGGGEAGLSLFAAQLRRMLHGEEAATEAGMALLSSQARLLGLSAPPLLPPPPPMLDREIPDSMLASLAEDFAPEAGALGERVHGDAWRALDTTTAAVLFFVPALGLGERPLDSWAGERQNRRRVAAMRQLDHAPPWIYRPDAAPSCGWTAVPWAPDQVLTAGCRIGRLYLHPAGVGWSGAFDLPAGLPLASAARRLQLICWQAQVHLIRAEGSLQPAHLERLLRLRSEMRYRSVLEQARIFSTGTFYTVLSEERIRCV